MTQGNAFRKSADGRILTLILEHVLTLYEQNKGIKASDYPFTIVRIKFDSLGQPLTGEVIPAAKNQCHQRQPLRCPD